MDDTRTVKGPVQRYGIGRPVGLLAWLAVLLIAGFALLNGGPARYHAAGAAIGVEQPPPQVYLVTNQGLRSSLVVYDLREGGWQRVYGQSWWGRTGTPRATDHPFLSSPTHGVLVPRPHECLIYRRHGSLFSATRVFSSGAEILQAVPAAPGIDPFAGVMSLLRGRSGTQLLFCSWRSSRLVPVWRTSVPRAVIKEIQLVDVDADHNFELAVRAEGRTHFDPVPRDRPYIYSIEEDGLRKKWLGSRLGRPFRRFTFADVAGDDGDDLIAIETMRPGIETVSVYTWNGFGFDFVGDAGELEAPIEIAAANYLWEAKAGLALLSADRTQVMFFAAQNNSLKRMGQVRLPEPALWITASGTRWGRQHIVVGTRTGPTSVNIEGVLSQ